MGPRSGDGIGDAAAFLPYGRQVLDDEDIAAVVGVLRGDWLTTGPTVDAYEERFRDLTGAAHAVACSSGTAGLHLAALASGIAPGDLVLVPAVTFLATANAVRFVGGEVVFADVDAETGLMTPATAAAALAAATGPVTAVMPVHLTGQAVDLPTMGAVLDGRRLIEDACHALGSRYPGMAGDDVAVGACPFGGITMFSSHPVKTIATGEGGMLTTNDGELAALLRRLRNHGMTRDAGALTRPELAFDPVSGAVNPWYYEMATPGLNYRLSDLHAALGLSQLDKLPGFIAQRRALHAHYHAGLGALGPHIRPAGLASKGVAAWHLAVALIDFDALGVTRAAVIDGLRARGIGSQVHYLPVPWQPYYRDRYGAGEYPGAAAYYRRILSLPLYPAMTIGDVDRVLDALDTVAHGR